MKHTPEPWEVYQLNHANDELWLTIGHEGRGPITELCGGVVKEVSPIARMRFLITPDEEQRANAYLIAAAPDLLAAAKAAIRYDRAIHACANDPDKMSSYCTAEGDDLDALYLDWIMKARAAIAKAEGNI